MAFDISDEQVTFTEKTLGRKLPPIYRATMIANNGGSASDDEDQWDIHPIKDTSERKRLSRSCNDILMETKAALEWRGFPNDAVAIGGNGFGDVMCLLPSDSDSTTYGEQIYVFWHETGEVKRLADQLTSLDIE